MKGFIFSLDAVLALILVMMAGAVITMQPASITEREDVSAALRQQAEDRAITAFYLGNSASESIDSGADYGECGVFYELMEDATGNNLENREPVIKIVFCEEA